MVRKESVDSALALLFSLSKTKKSARMLDKVLKAAVANLKEKDVNMQIETEVLKIKSITVDGGPYIKRIRSRAQGRAFRIQKKMCHLTIAISE